MRNLLIVCFSLAVLTPAFATTNDKFKSCFDQADTTLKMRECASKSYNYYTTVLDTSYQKLMSQLPDIGKQKLKSAERAWINYREKECEFSGFQAYQGTLEPVLIATCSIDLTQKRIKALEYYIKSFSPK